MSHPPVNLLPIDISAYKVGNTGVDYVHRFDSGRPGPHVMVMALTHGNELCGAYTLNLLFENQVQPERGVLTLGFSNVPAYESFDKDNPTASRFIDEDLNRVWSVDVLEGERQSAELTRARELRPVIDEVDYLLDIHSMQLNCAPLMLCGPLQKGRELATAVGVPETVVADEGHNAGRRIRDYGGFGDPASPRNSLLVECGQHWDPRAVEVSNQTTLRFLLHLGMITPAFAAPHLSAERPPAQRLIEVSGPITIQTDAFKFLTEFQGLEVIPEAGTVIANDGDEPVRTPYDDCVLIMPSRRLVPGQTAVRFGRFVN